MYRRRRTMTRSVVFGLTMTLVLAGLPIQGQSGDVPDDPLDQMVIAQLLENTDQGAARQGDGTLRLAEDEAELLAGW